MDHIAFTQRTRIWNCLGGLPMRLFRPTAVAALTVTFGAMLVSTPLASAQDGRDFTLINHTGETIWYVYVSPSSSYQWGPDIMGSDVLLPGDSTYITFEGDSDRTCTYDIEVQTGTGDTGELDSVNLCQTGTVTFN